MLLSPVFTRVQTRESVSKVISESNPLLSLGRLLTSCDCCCPRGFVSYQGTIVFYDRPQPGVLCATKLHGTVSNSARRVREGNGCCRLVYISESNTTTVFLNPTPCSSFRSYPSPLLPALIVSVTDGAGIFAGVLKHLLARGANCSKVIATTHFHELFTIGALDPRELPITFIHMEIMFATPAGEIIDDATTTITNGENITYLYRLLLISCHY